MATLYLIEQNTILRKSSDRLILSRMMTDHPKSPGVRVRDILLELPCEDVDQVMLFGNVQVTMQALQQLLRHGIELAIFTHSGKLLGQLTPPKTKNIHLRIAQFEKYRDPKFVLNFAKKVVQAKLGNALYILRQHRKNHPEVFTDVELQKLADIIQRLKRAKSPETLRGLEGAATSAYFGLFGRMLKRPWEFKKRTRMPPRDPVNAVLSFGYVIVGAELQSLLDGIGFDPYLGFYHSVHYGRPGLALDLLEEFRHSLVDRLALNLFNLNVLNTDDFYRPAKGGVLLNYSGKVKFFQHYERMLGEYGSATQPVPETSKTFRTVFQQRMQALAKALNDEVEYEPFMLR